MALFIYNTEFHRQIWGAYSRACTVAYRAIHAVWQLAQITFVRFQWQRRGTGSQRRARCFFSRDVVCNGVLPYKRRVLFRNADTDVCYRYRRLSAAGTVRRGYRFASLDCRLDIGVQRPTHRQLLRQDAVRSEMVEPDSRMCVCRYRSLLLYNDVLRNFCDNEYIG